MSVVLSICGDPGGAAAVAPVISMLSDRLEVHALCYRQARDVFQRYQIPMSELIENSEAVSRSVKSCSPDFLLLGTSVNGGDWELDALMAATGVPSLSVLDFWSNYTARFTHRSGVVCLPDRIAVMDEQARQEMAAEGFPVDRLIVTGQPAFDELAKKKAFCCNASLAQLNCDQTLSAREIRVAFVSQPILARCEKRECSKHTVLPELVDALEKISRSTKNRISLVIRPHPREYDDDFAWVQSEQISVSIDRCADPRVLLVECDLVAGMESALLLEACALGCVVASIQLNSGPHDCLPTNRMGLSLRISREKDLEPMIHSLLFDHLHRKNLLRKCCGWKLEEDATKNIVDLILGTLKTR